MSWLVTHVVASSPPGAWLQDLVRVLAKCADASGVRRWELRHLEVDSRDERTEVPPDPPWDRLRTLAIGLVVGPGLTVGTREAIVAATAIFAAVSKSR